MNLRLLTVAAALACAALGLWAAEPVKIADPKDKQLLDAFLKHALNTPQELSADKCKSMVEKSYGNVVWRLAPYSAMPLTAYELTGDAKYLDAFVQAFANLRSAMTKGRPVDDSVT